MKIQLIGKNSDAVKDWGQEEKRVTEDEMVGWHYWLNGHVAATAAKLLQLCPTLCHPIDDSPSGSPSPGILQARILEWGAIAFSTIDMSLSKVWETMKYREAWNAAVQRVEHDLASKQQQRIFWYFIKIKL